MVFHWLQVGNWFEYRIKDSPAVLMKLFKTPNGWNGVCLSEQYPIDRMSESEAKLTAELWLTEMLEKTLKAHRERLC